VDRGGVTSTGRGINAVTAMTINIVQATRKSAGTVRRLRRASSGGTRREFDAEQLAPGTGFMADRDSERAIISPTISMRHWP
jgi:hypothetical protein